MSDLNSLLDILHDARMCVLTGAGCSTESGIPDYRGEGTRARARNITMGAAPPDPRETLSPLRFAPRSSIQHREFIDSEATRRRYWARSAVGWPRMAGASPNAAHRALADLEARGRMTGLLTQNVDRLHHKAGSRNVLELHGALADVRCLTCNEHESRDALQRRITDLNGEFFASDKIELAPDGDAELSADRTANFRVPACAACGGILKPDVVFFGGSVPRARVDAAYAMLDAADVLLVVGSSLAVFSGYRFVLRARDRRIPVAIINRGATRGDAEATVRLDMLASEALSAIVLKSNHREDRDRDQETPGDRVPT